MLHSSLFTFIRTFAPALQARWSLRLSARTRDFHSLKILQKTAIRAVTALTRQTIAKGKDGGFFFFKAVLVT